MHILKQDLQKVFEIFMGQLRQLFGLKSDSLYAGASGTTNLLASERGFTEWWEELVHSFFSLQKKVTTVWFLILNILSKCGTNDLEAKGSDVIWSDK